jgi:hypothetical protein
MEEEKEESSLNVALTRSDLQFFSKAASDMAYKRLQDMREVKGIEAMEGNRNNRKGLERDFRGASKAYKRFCKLFDKLNNAIRVLNVFDESAKKPEGKCIKYTFIHAADYDKSKPDNGFSLEKEFIICGEGYSFSDWLADNMANGFEQDLDDDDTYYIVDEDSGERTGEAYRILSEELTEEPVN